MRTTLVPALALAICASLPAQTTQITFDCYPPGPFPANPGLGCEGIAGTNLPGSAVSATVSCGFPTLGPNFARLVSNGPVSLVNPGGPFPWPPANTVAQIRIPIPMGATAVTFDWEFFNAEGVNSSYNDGMSVNVVSQSGTLVQQLMYVDTSSPLGACTATHTGAFGSSTGTEILPAGPQTVTAGLPPLPTGCEYLAVICWNEGDNAVASATYLDNIVFNSSLAGCSVPCFSGIPTIGFTSPVGPGSLQVNLSGLSSNGTYFLAVTLTPGAFPNGWFYGLDIELQGVLNELSFGWPFVGPTDGCGGAIVGPFFGAPSGLALYAVGFGAIGPGLGTVVAITPATSYAIP